MELFARKCGISPKRKFVQKLEGIQIQFRSSTFKSRYSTEDVTSDNEDQSTGQKPTMTDNDIDIDIDKINYAINVFMCLS